MEFVAMERGVGGAIVCGMGREGYRNLDREGIGAGNNGGGRGECLRITL